MWTLISATPSPYARKVRVALAEKEIPFNLQTEVPWDSTTQTPQYNPLEKLPVLILDDGKTAIYESHFILEWLEAKHPETSMLPGDLDDRLFAKQVEVLCDGVCDALVLAFWERHREVGKQSAPWMARYGVRMWISHSLQLTISNKTNAQSRRWFADVGLMGRPK